MSRFVSVLALSGIAVLAGCVAPTPKPNDPYYAPVLPRTTADQMLSFVTQNL